MKDKVINDLLKRISDLEFEVEKQEQRIDKAIEFIKKYGTEAEKEVSYYEHKGERFCICASDFNEGAEIVLDILKGVDKE